MGDYRTWGLFTDPYSSPAASEGKKRNAAERGSGLMHHFMAPYLGRSYSDIERDFNQWDRNAGYRAHMEAVKTGRYFNPDFFDVQSGDYKGLRQALINEMLSDGTWMQGPLGIAMRSPERRVGYDKQPVYDDDYIPNFYQMQDDWRRLRDDNPYIEQAINNDADFDEEASYFYKTPSRKTIQDEEIPSLERAIRENKGFVDEAYQIAENRAKDKWKSTKGDKPWPGISQQEYYRWANETLRQNNLWSSEKHKVSEVDEMLEVPEK